MKVKLLNNDSERVFALVYEVGDEVMGGLKAFAKSTRTANLRSLTISNDGGLSTKKPKFTAAGVLALLNSARLPRLGTLDLDVNSKKFDTSPLQGIKGNPFLRASQRSHHICN